MVAGRFTAIPDHAEARSTEDELLAGAITAGRDAHGHALRAVEAVTNPTAARILRQFVAAIAAPFDGEAAGRG